MVYRYRTKGLRVLADDADLRTRSPHDPVALGSADLGNLAMQLDGLSLLMIRSPRVPPRSKRVRRPAEYPRPTTRGRRCRGQITAVIACRTDPETVIVPKGNRPLEMRWHPRCKAVLYASDPAYIDAVPAEEKGWSETAVPPVSLVVFRCEDLSGYSVEPFDFVVQEKMADG